jgi:hypothetical protein
MKEMKLSKYKDELPLGLVTDASDKGIGACLFQVINNKMMPIEFYSKKLREQNINVFQIFLVPMNACIFYLENISLPCSN